MLVIKRIHVTYLLKAPAEMQDTVERVHEFHAKHCPVYRSLDKAIEMSTEYRLQE